MYLKVQEQCYKASYLSNDNIEISYDIHNISTHPENVFVKSTIIVDQYVCLFDDSFQIIDEVFDFLENRLRVKSLSFNTVATKGSDLKLFYDFLTQYKLSYKSLSQNNINDFIAWLMLPDINSNSSHLNITSKRTAKTVNRIISSIRDFYSYHNNYFNIANPFKNATEIIKRPTRRDKGFYAHTNNDVVKQSIFKIKEFDKGIRVLNQEQIELILNTCTMQRDKLLFELLLFTGMRIGEALSLDIHAIGVCEVGQDVQDLPMNQQNNNMHIQGYRYRQQKSGPRDIFIPTFLMKKLSSYYEDVWLPIYEKKEMEHEFFFISEFHNNLGAPLSYQAVWDRCRKIGKKCGVFFTPHDFRHTFATTLAKNDVTIDRLRTLMGHRDIGSTDIYIQIAAKEDIVKELLPFYESYGVLNG